MDDSTRERIRQAAQASAAQDRPFTRAEIVAVRSILQQAQVSTALAS